MFLSKFVLAKYVLILICALFLFTRLYKISEIPQSVYWDEASIGYNAYSVLNSGQDEWGNFLPIHFRAFGEFKLPVYVYSVTPFIRILGLNELSVRLPAVLFSLGIIILTYLLAKKFSDNESVGLLAAFITAVSPWFFIFSRTSYEVTAGLMFYLLGIYLFLKMSSIHRLNFLLSMLNFILSIYSYNSFRIITPLTILILAIVERENIIDQFKRWKLLVLLTLVLFILSFWPIYRLYIYDAGISRLQAVGGVTVESFLKNYISHFNLDFLFLDGDRNLRSQQSGFGQLYLLQLPFIIAGLIFLLKNSNKYTFLVVVLLLLGPIPASITKESPHALRSLSMVPFVSMISAYGAIYISNLVKRRYFFKIAIVLIFFAFFLIYFLSFLNKYPYESSKEWQMGYKQIFTKYKDDFDRYHKIIVSDSYAQPYIFALFYLKYDPEKFRKEVVRNEVSDWGFSTVSSFGKFKFKKAHLISEEESINALIFAAPDEKIDNVRLISAINFSDGTIAFLIYKHE